MAQHDMIIDDQAGLSFLSDLNAVLAALVSNSSGATEPADTFPYMWWADTTSGWLKQRNAADSAWVNKLSLADATSTVGAALISAASVAAAQQAMDVEVGVDVQAYDAANALTDTEQTWTQVQRTNENIVTSLTLDLDATYLDFRCTPAAGGALTFSNIPASPLVQKGTITFVNGSNYAITAHANTKVGSTLLATISATGTYMLSYRTGNGVCYITSSGALA